MSIGAYKVKDQKELDKLLKPRKQKEVEKEIGTTASRVLVRLEKDVRLLEKQFKQDHVLLLAKCAELEGLKRRLTNE